ncbi:MAG: hypothetical protein ABIV36_20530, partial [Sphingobium limneticum]
MTTQFGELVGRNREEFASHFGNAATWRPIEPEVAITFPAPRYIAGSVPADRTPVFPSWTMTASEAGCLVLDGAYLYDCGLAIKEDSLLLDPTVSVPPAELGAWGWYSRVESVGDNKYRIQRPMV